MSLELVEEAYMYQLCIDVKDRPGELAKVVGLLANQNIDIKALYLGESRKADGIGIVKAIVTDGTRAIKVLEDEGFPTRQEQIIVIAIEDHPGGLYAVLEQLARAEINIGQIYSFVTRIEGKALSVFEVDDFERASRLLAQSGITIIDQPAQVNSAAQVPGEPDLSDFVGGVFYW
jgi:hypothetical protein